MRTKKYKNNKIQMTYASKYHIAANWQIGSIATLNGNAYSMGKEKASPAGNALSLIFTYWIQYFHYDVRNPHEACIKVS